MSSSHVRKKQDLCEEINNFNIIISRAIKPVKVFEIYSNLILNVLYCIINFVWCQMSVLSQKLNLNY